jgi:RNA polymerase sigma factor (sigma-70 family)
MERRSFHPLIQRLLQRVAPHGGVASDSELLQRFASHREESAFETIVWRHGPLVLGVCERLLHDAQAAEDAFQATFLVLVRKGASIHRQQSLGSWLFKVAYRIALRARKRLATEPQAAEMLDLPAPTGVSDLVWRDLRPVLDEALDGLPEKYRLPLVLHYLEDKTMDQVASELGWPKGTVSGRLDRGKHLLRKRLLRQGVTLSAAALATALGNAVAATIIPTRLVHTTLRSTLVAGQASASVIDLAEGCLRGMFLDKIKQTVVALASLCVLVVGAGLLAPQAPASAAEKELIRSARTGPWSAGETWEGGKIPAPLSKVQIRSGHTVTYDRQSDDVIRSIHVGGTLSFARDRDTKLCVGLIKIQPGDDASENGFDCDAHTPELKAGEALPALEVGTPERPIDAKHTALIRLTFVEGLDKLSCPAIVCCGGRMDFHGMPMNRTWVKLGAAAKQDEASVTLAEAVTGWKAGDHIIVTATQREYGKNKTPSTEERTIQAIDGTKLTLDKPLEKAHLGDGDYRGEVANLSRNVIVESADPKGERGHTMYHRRSAGGISYAEFRHLGKPGVLGRYSLHYHLVGDTMRGSSVIGVSIWDSGNRWLTIHGTNYLVVRDCVGYQSLGHGFYLEDGTEVYNVLDRNLAVGAKRTKKLPKQMLPFDENEGAGFWWANSLNTFTRNVATENGLYGFRFEATQTSALKLTLPVLQPDGSHKPVDIRTLPFVRFDDNETHSGVGLYGVNLGEGVNRVGPDRQHPFVVRNLKIWNVHYAFRPQVPSLQVENLTIHRAEYGVYHPNYDNHVYKNVVISQTNTEPFNRGHDDISAQYGALTVDGLTFAGVSSGDQMPLIQISDDNPTGVGVTHIKNLRTVDWKGSKRRAIVNRGGGPRPEPKTDKGVPVYVHDWFGPGRHAKVVSTKAKDMKADNLEYREESNLTGDESRVAEVRDVEFPKLLDPIDDLPPTTVITQVQRSAGKLTVRGVASDNGTIKRVLVNGKEARALRDNFAEWEITLETSGATTLKAHAEDAAGNVEKLEHVVSVR